MTILILESVTTVLVLAFGLIALQVARASTGASPQHRLGWASAGLGFTASSSLRLWQSIWAVLAFRAGPGSGTWDGYLYWAPAFNHAMGTMLFVLIGALLLIPFLRTTATRRFLVIFFAILIAAGGIGAFFGLQSGPFVDGRHYFNLAIVDSARLPLLFATLLVLLRYDGVDRLLWISLGVFAMWECIHLLWLTALTWFGVPGAWRPPIWLLEVLGMIAYSVMSALAVICWRQARHGVRVPGLLEGIDRGQVRIIG